MVAVAQRLRRQVVALKIEGSIPSSHPKSTQKVESHKLQYSIINPVGFKSKYSEKEPPQIHFFPCHS